MPNPISFNLIFSNLIKKQNCLDLWLGLEMWLAVRVNVRTSIGVIRLKHQICEMGVLLYVNVSRCMSVCCCVFRMRKQK